MHLTNTTKLCCSLATLALTGTVFAQVAGDECGSAIVAIEGDNAFDTTAMTASANPPADGACTYLDWGASKDVWFSWTASGDGTLDISLCGSAYDTSMVVYEGDCTTQISCNDDSCGANYESIIMGLGVSAGTQYYIRIGGWNADFGAGNMNLYFAAVADGCAGATGSCSEAHGGLGCSDANCCTAVCAINPLCCIIGWDADCVTTAVDTCGIFIYNCVAGGPANNCATNATAVTASGTVNFTNVGATTDGPAYGDSCASGNNENNHDVWFKVGPVVNGVLGISSCGLTPFDNKTACFDMGLDAAAFDFNTLPAAMVACNDDGPGGTCFLTDGATPYASAMDVTVNAGHTYLVCVSSYTAGDVGAGQITFTLPSACSLGGTNGSEGEACGSDSNGGCGSGAELTSPLAVGDSLAGTFWADADFRDVDWYTLTVTEAMDISVDVRSNSNSIVAIYAGDTCTGLAQISAGSGFCPVAAAACLNAGSYRVAVATQDFAGNPCGSGSFNDYSISVAGTTSICPSFGDTCDHTIASTVSQNLGVDYTNYAMSCLLWCGVPGTTFTVAANSARSFSGLNSGYLACATVAVANMDEGADDVWYANGSPAPFTLALYRDIDGGDPMGVDVDLELIVSKDFLALGGYSNVTWNLDAPIDLEGNTDPIVLVMSTPEANACDANTNYLFGGLGNNAGSTAPWFAQSLDVNGICPDAAFVAQTGASQWIVDLGLSEGDATPCPTDLDGNGAMDGADLAILLGGWGGPSGDIDGDGTTNGADLAALLGVFGTACP